ncbi:SUMF1/EgtB/PvdO family nonheme iron enzyme [Agrobacterium vitis]|uniref:SUMF1/EgtB/PvdO family nonheme iron enzyme n=1 Tax=Agrobacterium vitis TaxID=373 RepID=UPI0008DC16B9|nr:SUMF1/EgtB/PvdO family nonheme iron enzyme [Agrobacterium vitis]MUO85282.1 SUMF1/EgtB/PvdO family nonheme iron enzyme [Agrobacterium vitis]
MSGAALTPRHPISIGSVLLPLLLIGALSTAVVFQSAIVRLNGGANLPAPHTISVAPGSFPYRQPGEYYRAGYAVDGPKADHVMTAAITIMKYQVSTQDYDACVADGACPAREMATPSRPDMPATGVSHDDATVYAWWFSKKSGGIWRLPSDVELAFAAGTKFPDDALGIDPDNRNPALRWLADYEREAARKRSKDPEPLPYGSFGENEHGLADFAGNVWEWTTTCNRRVDLVSDGQSVSTEACGVYIAAGKHRSPLSSFIRDPKSGGCSVGVPPDHVGFRLVEDRRWYAPLLFSIGAL